MSDTVAAQANDPQQSSSWTQYRELVEQSNLARAAGRHLEAQRFASAARKWSMDESIRLQRLEHALEKLQEARSRLDSAWDKDRSCATVGELVERHPELERSRAGCADAEERVQALATPSPSPEVPEVPEPRGWRAPRSMQSGA